MPASPSVQASGPYNYQSSAETHHVNPSTVGPSTIKSKRTSNRIRAQRRSIVEAASSSSQPAPHGPSPQFTRGAHRNLDNPDLEVEHRQNQGLEEDTVAEQVNDGGHISGDHSIAGPSHKPTGAVDNNAHNGMSQSSISKRDGHKRQLKKGPERLYKTKNVGPSGPMYSRTPPRIRKFRRRPRPVKAAVHNTTPAQPAPRRYLGEMGDSQLNRISGQPVQHIAD